MKNLLLLVLVCMFSISISPAADDLERSNTMLTQAQYLEILPHIKALHTKGPYTYNRNEIKELKYDWKELSPSMIIVQHNNVDLIFISKDTKVIRHNFNRFVGAWSAKKVIWVVNYYFDTSEREQINLGEGYILSDEEYKRDRLYSEYLQSNP